MGPVFLSLITAMYLVNRAYTPAIAYTKSRAASGKTRLNSFFAQLGESMPSVRAIRKQAYFSSIFYRESDDFGEVMFTNKGAVASLIMALSLIALLAYPFFLCISALFP